MMALPFALEMVSHEASGMPPFMKHTTSTSYVPNTVKC